MSIYNSFISTADNLLIPSIRNTQDTGNTNYSIAIPRTSFDRRTNAELVARGIVSLGVDAYVNERNDVTVGGFKIRFFLNLSAHYLGKKTFTYLIFYVDQHVSGSAYKIVNKRAYHHGTMLINAQLGTLGDLLRNKKVGTTLLSSSHRLRSFVFVLSTNLLNPNLLLCDSHYC